MLRFRLAYIAALIVGATAFVVTNEPVALAVPIALLSLAAICALVCFRMAATMGIRFGLSPSCTVGQPLSLEMEVSRPRFLPACCIEFEATCRNVVLGEELTIPVLLEASSRRSPRFELPLATGACGRMEIVVRTMRVRDPLNLARREAPCSYQGSCTVYPRVLDLSVDLDRSPRASLSGSSYDSRRRGQDRSEPFDVRDYRASDPLNAIHWKLSTKVGKLMVREASHPSNYDVLILVDMATRYPEGGRVDDEVVTAAFELAASLSLGLCRRDMGHNVAVASSMQASDTMVDSMASFESAVDMLVGTPLPESFGVDAELFELYRRERGFTKTVLITGVVDPAALVEMSRSVDLSVLYVTVDGANGVEDLGAYDLVSISSTSLDDRVRSVAI